MLKVLKNLIKTIKTNKKKDIKISYTAYLFKKGKKTINKTSVQLK